MRPDAVRRFHGDTGAAIAEFALIVPVLAIFMLGIIDYGMLFKADNQVEHALMSGGRVAAQQSKARLADYEALRMLKASLDGIQNASVQKVVIYRADNANGKVPSTCLNPTPSGPCNVYNSTKFNSFTKSNFAGTGTCSGGSWDLAWCPTTRNPQADHIGIYVEIKYDHLTGMIPSNYVTKQYTVYSVEPTPIQIGSEMTP